MEKLIKMQYRIRVFGALAAMLLINLSEYHDNDLILLGTIFTYMILSSYVRFGNFSKEKELLINRAILYMDVGVLSLAIALRGGIRSDFYLGYYFILGYVMHVRDKYLIYKLSIFIGVIYSLIVVAFSPIDAISIERLLIRLVLIIGTSVVFQVYVRELMLSENLREDALNLAYKDPLTKVYNRRQLETIEKDYGSNARINHVILIDIDDFKQVNDNYGHDVGDDVLIDLAHLLSSDVQINGTCIRFGGEEFLLLVSKKSTAETFEAMDTIRRNFASKIYHWQESYESVTFTSGIAEHHADDTLDQTIRKADTAMYHGKKTGKNQVVQYEANMSLGFD